MEKLKNLLSPGKAIDDETLYGAFPEVKGKHSKDNDDNKDSTDSTARSASQEKSLGSQVINPSSNNVARYPIDAGFTPIEHSERTKVDDATDLSAISTTAAHGKPKGDKPTPVESDVSTRAVQENPSSHTMGSNSSTAATAAVVAANTSSTKEPTTTGATEASTAQPTQVTAAQAAINPRDMPGAFPGADPREGSHHLDAGAAGGGGAAEIAAQRAYSKHNPDTRNHDSKTNPYSSTLVDSRVDPHATQPDSGTEPITASTDPGQSAPTAASRGIDHKYGRGAGLAAGAGAASVGAYAASNKHEEPHSSTVSDTTSAPQTSTTGPTTSSTGYHAEPVGTALSGTSTSSTNDHAHVRNPALGQGITSGAASGEIMSRGRDDYSTSSPTSGPPDHPASSVAGVKSNIIGNTPSSTGVDNNERAFPLAGGTSQLSTGQSPHQTQSANRLDPNLDSAKFSPDEKHHYGRDAAVAGGVGAAGLAVYEAKKVHDEKETPSDRLAGQPGATESGAPGLTGTAPGQAIGDPKEKLKDQKHHEKEAEKAHHKAEKEAEKEQHKIEKEAKKEEKKEHKEAEKAIEKEEKEANKAEKAHKKDGKDGEKETPSKPSFFSRLLGLGGNGKEEEGTEADDKTAMEKDEDVEESHRGRNAALAAGAGAAGVGAYAASKPHDDKAVAASEAAPSKEPETSAAPESLGANTTTSAPHDTTIADSDRKSGPNKSSATDPGAPGITGTAPGEGFGEPPAGPAGPASTGNPIATDFGAPGTTGAAPGQAVDEPYSRFASADKSSASEPGAPGITSTAPSQVIDDPSAKGARKQSQENNKGHDAAVGGGILAAAAGVAGYGYEKQFKERKNSSSSYPYNFSSEPRADADGIGAAPVSGMKYEKVNKEKQQSSSYPYSFSTATGTNEAQTNTTSTQFRDVLKDAAETGTANTGGMHASEAVQRRDLDDRDPLDTSPSPQLLAGPDTENKTHHYGRDALLVGGGVAAAGYGSHELSKDKENQREIDKTKSDLPAVSDGSAGKQSVINTGHSESKADHENTTSKDGAGLGASAIAAGYGTHKLSEPDQKLATRGPILSDTSHSSSAYSASPKESRASLDRSKKSDELSHREDRPRKQSLVTKVLSGLKDKDHKKAEQDHTHGRETAAVGAGAASATYGAHERSHNDGDEKKHSHGRKPSLIKRMLHLDKKEDDTSPRSSSEKMRKNSDKSRKSSDKYRDEAAVGAGGVAAAGLAAQQADIKQTPSPDRVTYAADHSVGQAENRTSTAGAIGNEVVDSEPSSTEFTSAQKGKQAAEPESAFGGMKSGYQTHPLGTMKDVGDDHAAHWEDVTK